MKKFYSINSHSGQKKTVITLLLIFFLTSIVSAQDLLLLNRDSICTNGFSTSVTDVTEADGCVTIDLVVYSDGTESYALSHLTIGVPCGNVSGVYNSEGWPVEMHIEDPTTGLTGVKIDNISNFGKAGARDSFTVSYTVCSSDTSCLAEILSGITVAYKAGECVFIEDAGDIDSGDTGGGSDDGSDDGGGEVTVDSLAIILNPQNVTCFNGSNGTVVTEVNGGIAPYTYVWNNGSSTANLSNLTAGTYSVTVTDSKGETVEGSAEITQPESGIAITAGITHASCTKADGSIDLAVSGGTAPYSYSWSNGNISEDLVNVAKGMYIVTVTDDAGCTSSKALKIEENTTLAVQVTANYLECYQEGQGEVSSAVTGGTAPYSYAWSTGDTTSEISGVNSGLYNLTVTDAEGCAMEKSAWIGIRNLSVSFTSTSPTCSGGNDGEAAVSNVGYGTGPFNYEWNTGDTTAALDGLSSGNYVVTVTDSFGCVATRSVTVSDRPPLSISYSVSPRDCSTSSDAEVTINGSGGSGSYEFYLGDSLISSPVTLPGDGDYEIVMIDGLGCETSSTIHLATSQNLNIVKSVTQPSCGGLQTGFAVISANSGTAPYDYTWDDGTTGASRNNLLPGDYSIDVVDANGCSASTSITINEILDVTASLEAPGLVDCNSPGNVINATSTNATGFSWEIQSNDNSWFISDSTMNSATYQAGNGTALFTYNVWNDDGCSATDTLSLVCTTVADTTGSDPGNTGGDDGSIDTGGTDDGSGDGTVDGECGEVSWETEITQITPTGGDCYHFELTVRTTGYAEHDLSHLVVGLDYGYVSDVTNSANYKIESNTTDPKSGVYGFKIDDISGFGSGIQEFTISFNVCFNNPDDDNYIPDVIRIIYKAGTCTYEQDIDVHTDSETESGITAKAYPNPFMEEMSIIVNSKIDTKVNISIYDMKGNKVIQLYDGRLAANVNYTFTFNASDTNGESIFIYTIVSADEIVQGRILKLQN